MPIVISCPSCQARLNAPDTAMGKTVKCPKCQTPIKVGASGGAAAPAPAKTAPAPAKKPALPPEDDFAFDNVPPPKKGPVKKGRDDDYDDDPPPAKKKPARDDDDYDDDRPSKRGGAVKKARDDYDDEPKGRGRRDDDYDDDDAPRKKKGRSGGGNQPTPTEDDKTQAFNLYLFMILGNFLCGGLGTIIFLVMWLSKRKEIPLVDWHGKQVVNTWITSILVVFLLVILGVGSAFALGAIDPSLALIGLVFYGLIIAYSIFLLVVMIMGMMKAKSGIYWKFPMTLQLLK